MDNQILSSLLELIKDNKITELEAERLLNAAARLDAGVPTGISKSHTNTHIK